MLRPTTLVLLALLALGCTRSESPEETASEEEEVAGEGPVRGDWMVRWLLSDPESLNPVTSNDAAASTVSSAIHATLLTRNPETLELIPFAAKARPEIAEDKLHYTFRLRDDVTFSDGKALTVADVLFSIKVIKNPEVNAPHLRNYFLSITDARPAGEGAVEFEAAEPYFLNESILGSIPLLPRHFYDPNGELEGISVGELAEWESMPPAKRERAARFAKSFNRDFHRTVLGASGYELRDPERNLITGERLVLDRRESYWAPGDTLRGDGWVDRMFFRVINDQNAALVSLKAGTLDLMSLTPLQHFKQTNTPGFEARFDKHLAFTPSYTYIGWNQRHPVLADRAVRRALSHLVDRKRIIEKVLFGLGETIDSPIYKFRPEYNHDIEGYGYDPAKAKRILEEAGWIDSDRDGVRDHVIDGERVPLRFEIISNSGNSIRKNVGLIVIDELRRAGIAASFREIDWSIMLERMSKGEHEGIILGWAMSVNEPDMFQLWHSSQIAGGGSNHVAFRDEEADRLLEEYRRTFDEEERIRMCRRLQEIIHREAPYTFLFMQKGVSAFDRRFRNTEWYPTGSPNLFEWWVPRPLQRWGQ